MLSSFVFAASSHDGLALDSHSALRANAADVAGQIVSAEKAGCALSFRFVRQVSPEKEGCKTERRNEGRQKPKPLGIRVWNSLARGCWRIQQHQGYGKRTQDDEHNFGDSGEIFTTQAHDAHEGAEQANRNPVYRSKDRRNDHDCSYVHRYRTPRVHEWVVDEATQIYQERVEPSRGDTHADDLKRPFHAEHPWLCVHTLGTAR